VVSPLLANVYLHRLDRAWRGAYGTLARYADDALVMCRSKGQAEAALARLTALLAELGLKPKLAKTRIVKLEVGGEGVDFLGFHHRLVRYRSRRRPNSFTFLARWPSRKAMQHARDRIRFMTMRARLAAPVGEVVWDINLFLRGWAGYFRYGNSAHAFGKIRKYALMRLALFVAKRHQRGRAWGFNQLYRSPNDLGLISLNGIVVAPGPTRPGGSSRTPPVKNVGEPCAGEPHARIDGRELETEHADQWPPGWHTRPGNRRNIGPGSYQSTTVTAPAPDPTILQTAPGGSGSR
jgi:RNA-directed DNA polymerase